jgi:hypothetical protein
LSSVEARIIIPTMTAQFLRDARYHWKEFSCYFVFFGQCVCLL